MKDREINELDPVKTVVVATGNAHKVTEIEAILAPVMPGVRFVALGELGDFPDPVEDGDTFFDNALIKARAAQAETGLPMAVADDSGLCVDALDGAPGIFSARWAGEHGNDTANNEKLMAQMADVPEAERTARFHSSVVLVRGGRAIFSCNLRSFKPDVEKLERAGVRLTDITDETIPEDFSRNRKIHHAYLVERVAAET